MSDYLSDQSFAKLILGGLTGATAGGRFVGFVASGAPASGTYLTNDLAFDIAGNQWQLCTAGGSPGTWAGGGSGGDLVKIATIALDSVQTFSAISGAYKTLQIDWTAYSTAGSPGQGIMTMQFNADTGANYESEYQWLNGTSSSITQSVTATSAVAGYIPDKTNITTPSGAGRIVLPGYAGTALFKSFHQESHAFRANSNGCVDSSSGGGGWASTSAITSITLIPYASAFGSGSFATLYGLNG